MNKTFTVRQGNSSPTFINNSVEWLCPGGSGYAEVFPNHAEHGFHGAYAAFSKK